MKNRIYLSSPHMGGEEQAFIQEALDSNWVAPLGPHIDGLERDICKYTGSPYCAVLSSGTSAIHLALMLLGVQQGDEVLASTFTFSATINPILYQKAKPILIESEPDTWNISPHFLEEAIEDRIKAGKKPKAIIIVHLYGMPAKMDELMSIARKYEIPVIEDAAEALGSRYKGRMLGTLGDMGVISFNGNKIITTSGGGALISENKSWIYQAVFLATQARDKAPHYEHTQVGYNYRLSNISAGIGRGQMKVLEERVKKRREVNQFYRSQLGGRAGLSFLTEPGEEYYSNYWLTTLVFDPEQLNGLTRDDICLALDKENIEARPLWKPMHLQPVFKDYPYFGDRYSDLLFEKGLCLPSGSNLTPSDLERIARIISEACRF